MALCALVWLALIVAGATLAFPDLSPRQWLIGGGLMVLIVLTIGAFHVLLKDPRQPD